VHRVTSLGRHRLARTSYPVFYRKIRGRGWYGYIPTSLEDVLSIPGHAAKFFQSPRVQKAALGLASVAGLGAAAYYGMVPPGAVQAAAGLVAGTNKIPYLRHLPGVASARRVANIVTENQAAGERHRALRVPANPHAGFRPRAMAYVNNNNWKPR
jgi:hypothetical protein